MAAAATRNCAVAEHSAAEVGVAEPAVDEAVGGAVAGVVVGGPDAPPEQPTIAVNPMSGDKQERRRQRAGAQRLQRNR
jgi:hypothetical protein